MKFIYKHISVIFREISEKGIYVEGEYQKESRYIMLNLSEIEFKIVLGPETDVISYCFKREFEGNNYIVDMIKSDIGEFITFLFAKSPLRILLMNEFPEMSLKINKEGL
jgi:hypothetical protein